ncbi:RNA polymerase subunit sigma-70 [Solirubrobacter sp. CPCC 204708]|nr:RNA polymerase subunit sigma-70 [Solirubrobacter deserti]
MGQRSRQTTAPEATLIEAARAGDEKAFESLVAPYRRALHAHCYRMLGTLADSEDAVQDSMLRAWRGLAGFDGRSSLRNWLHRIATNASLDVIAHRGRSPVLLAEQGPPTAEAWDPETRKETEVLWLQPLPDEGYERREGVELAFIAALEHLSPNQRAALIMREVLGFSAREVAEVMTTSEPSVKSALQRARARLDERVPNRSQQETLRALGDTRVQMIVRNYADAFERGDVDGLVSMLADHAEWSMSPYSLWYSGRDAIRQLLATGPAKEGWRHRFTSANGQPAVGCYRWDARRAAFVADGIDVLTLDDDGRILAMTALLDPALFARFGLPERIDS